MPPRFIPWWLLRRSRKRQVCPRLEIPVPVEIAYGGTCTAGKNEDMDMYARVLADALRQGKKVADR